MTTITEDPLHEMYLDDLRKIDCHNDDAVQTLIKVVLNQDLKIKELEQRIEAFEKEEKQMSFELSCAKCGRVMEFAGSVYYPNGFAYRCPLCKNVIYHHPIKEESS